MSLFGQSQTWFPTSVKVTVHQARGLRVKGKNGTNDTYAIIQVAKDKFSTSVAEKSVSPVWKEEASFDLPLFHLSNAKRCTLYVIVMHRSHVGLDKFLGQAVVSLLEMFDNKSCKKTNWFELVDKTGKQDKPRGEVLLDIQFMKNNMSASMLDLSMQQVKPGFHISKLKEKVRRRKKNGFSDSASAIVSSSSHISTDSEGEVDTQSLSQSSGGKKKSKIKTFFAPKSNLQRNISQSLSTIKTFPDKNLSPSGSCSSGLNGDPLEDEKAFKFLGQKQTHRFDSGISQGPVTLLGGFKQSNSELNNLCNSSHVYTEQTKTGSNVSLKSIEQGSLDNVLKDTSDADSRCVSCMETDRDILEQQCHLWREDKRQEKKHIAQAKFLEDEEKYRHEGGRLKEEEERRSHEELEKKRCTSENNAHKKQREEESSKQEEELQMLESAENHKREEDFCNEEEQKQQEQISMSERLTSLFGIIKKKEDIKDEPPTQACLSDSSQPISHYSTNPFEDIPLNSNPFGNGRPQKTSISHQVPSGNVFLNRTAKVSAVKPSVGSPLAPSDIQTSLFRSFCDGTKNISSAVSSAIMAEKKRAPPPPLYQTQETQNGRNHIKVKAINNPVYEEEETSQQRKKMSKPLPDYETLFPQKRHGVQGHTQWDHIIAEVNQKNMDTSPKFIGKEMSVDGPETKLVTMQKPAPQNSTKTVILSDSQPTTDSSQQQNLSFAQSSTGPRSSSVQRPVNSFASSREVLVRSVNKVAKVSESSVPVPQQTGQKNAFHTQTSGDDKNTQLTGKKDVPTAKPRQNINGNQLREQDGAVTPFFPLASSLTSNTSISGTEKNSQWTENFALFDPFPSNDLLKDPWTQLTNNQQDPFTGGGAEERELENCGMTADDLNDVFSQITQVDPFANFNCIKLNSHSDYKEDSKDLSCSFKEKQNENLVSTIQSNQTLKSHETLTPVTQSDLIRRARNRKNESPPQKSQTDVKTPNAVGRREDLFGTEPFSLIPPRAFSDSIQVVIEEPTEYQAENGSGRKMPLRARVSPSEIQPLSAHNGSGSGHVFFQCRPHPVKPISSTESQHPISSPAVTEKKVPASTAEKIEVTDLEIRPYTLLTQEELITLVVKQQSDLSSKDAKIVQLEEYIDSLLVRVIEEKPSILQCLQGLK